MSGGPASNEYDYDDWAELLSGFFFDAAHQGREILFAADEGSLADASGLPQAAACASLAKAVERVIGPDWNVARLRRKLEKWDGAGHFHPAIPFLALTVLAAYRMGSFDGMASRGVVGIRGWSSVLSADGHELGG